MRIDHPLTPRDLLPKIDRMFELSAGKIRSLEASWPADAGAPVFTVDGPLPVARLDRMDARVPVRLGASCSSTPPATPSSWSWAAARTVERMAPHLTHVGVHDHGFNNVSTYGGLWRLAREGRIDAPPWELRFYELALKVSGAVQAKRWTTLPDGGYIYSFNGAHSLFVDTIRSLRALAISHMLGHRLSEEQDVSVNLLERLLQHARATARFAVYYGDGRDTYDVRGRTAHESLFNAANGTYRGPSTPAGLFAVLDLDPRARLGDDRLRRAAGVRRDTRRCRARRRTVDARRSRAGCSTRRAPRATSTSIRAPRPTASRTGTPARPA